MAGEVFILGAGGSGGAGGSELAIVGGTTRPAKPSQNMIWVNTDVDITSLVLSSTELNTYAFKCDKLNGGADDAHGILVPFQLKVGDILNFIVPVTTTGVFEAVRLKDSLGKEYCVRHENGTAVTEWTAGTKICVRISNTAHQIGSWGNDGSAYIIKWGSYNHEEGMVWIAISDSGSVKMTSPVGGDWITLYPISAKQYVSGEWIDVSAMSYQNSVWTDWWNGELFKNGSQFHYVTGGWTAEEYTFQGQSNIGSSIGETITIDNQSTGNIFSGVGTTNLVDLSRFTTIHVNVTAVKESIAMCVVSNKSIWDSTIVARIDITNTGITPLPIDGIDSGYIIILCNGKSGTARSATISEVWME